MNHPVSNSPSAAEGKEPKFSSTIQYSSNDTISPFLPGVLRYTSTMPIYSNPDMLSKNETRVVSVPIRADTLEFDRENKL